jgi:hypothetical protein
VVNYFSNRAFLVLPLIWRFRAVQHEDGKVGRHEKVIAMSFVPSPLRVFVLNNAPRLTGEDTGAITSVIFATSFQLVGIITITIVAPAGNRMLAAK